MHMKIACRYSGQLCTSCSDRINLKKSCSVEQCAVNLSTISHFNSHLTLVSIYHLHSCLKLRQSPLCQTNKKRDKCCKISCTETHGNIDSHTRVTLLSHEQGTRTILPLRGVPSDWLMCFFILANRILTVPWDINNNFRYFPINCRGH